MFPVGSRGKARKGLVFAVGFEQVGWMEEPEVEDGEFVPDLEEENLAMDLACGKKGEGDWDERRKGLPSGLQFNQFGVMEEKEIEDGEFVAGEEDVHAPAESAMEKEIQGGGGVPSQEETKFMDPSNSSYIDEKLDYLFGHLRYKFDRELSAENLGTMFGGYGSFLGDEPSSPSIPVEPNSTQGRVKTSLFRGSGKDLMNSREKGQGNLMLSVGNWEEGRKGMEVVLETDRVGRMEKEVEDDDFVPNQEENPAMHTTDEHRNGNKEQHLESEHAPAESPRSILEMMISFPIPGGHLISPLPESVLNLKRREPPENPPLPGVSKCHILDSKAPKSPSIPAELSNPQRRVRTSLVEGSVKCLVDSGEKGQEDLMLPGGNSDEGSPGLAIVLERDQVGIIEEKDIKDDEFVPDQDENLSMHPIDHHRDGNEEHPPESEHGPYVSPMTIVQIMTTLPIPGGRLFSPIPESVLNLKKREPLETPPLPGLSKCNIFDRKASSSPSIPVELSSQHGRLKTSLIKDGRKGLVDSGEKGRGDMMLPVGDLDEGRMGLAVVVELDQVGKEKDIEDIEFVPGHDKKLSMHPIDNHRDATEEHPRESLHAPTESPGTILQIMTTLPISGGQLLSPLTDSLLHLKEREPPQTRPLPRLSKYCNPEAETTKALDALFHIPVQSSDGGTIGNSGRYLKSKRKRKADQDDYRLSKKSNKEGAIEDLHPKLEVGGRHPKSGCPKDSIRTSYGETNDAAAVSSKKRKMCSDFENDRSSCPEKRWKQTASFSQQKSPDSRRSVKPKVSNFRGNIQQRDIRALGHSLSKKVGRTEVAFGRGKSQLMLPSKNEQELQTRARKGLPKFINRGGCPNDATKVVKESDTQNGPSQDIPNHPDTSSPRRKCGNSVATKVLEEATGLKHFADRLQKNGSELESTDLYFQAALKFLQAAFLLQPPSFENTKYDDASQSTEFYSKTARLCEFCAHKYEKFNQFANSALAYKCLEVAHMKVAYYKHRSATKDQRELQTALQMVKTHSALDKTDLGKGTCSPQVAGSNIIATHHCPTVVRLLNFTDDINCSFEATRNSQNALAAAIAILGPDGHACISSVKRVINSNFHDVERFIRMAVFEMRLKVQALEVSLLCCSVDMISVSSRKQDVLIGDKTREDFDNTFFCGLCII